MVRIRFPDGTSILGTDADDVIDKWARKSGRFPDVFREELAKRAYVWSRTVINSSGTGPQFLRELERAGLLKIEE